MAQNSAISNTTGRVAIFLQWTPGRMSLLLLLPNLPKKLNSNMAKFYTFDPRKSKKVLIGEVVGEALFKTVDPTKHFMRVVGGYGIQYQALLELKQAGIKKIIIKEDGGNQWEAPLDSWFNHSKLADYGSGKQYFLGLKFMTPHKRVEAKTFEPLTFVPSKKEEPQPSLF